MQKQSWVLRLGHNGVEISVGKLIVYTAGAALTLTALSVVIDAGTNCQELLDDPLYSRNATSVS